MQCDCEFWILHSAVCLLVARKIQITNLLLQIRHYKYTFLQGGGYVRTQLEYKMSAER